MRALLIVVASLAIAGCSQSKSQQQPSASATTAGMITMTSKSPEAVEHLKKGEALVANVRTSEAIAEFDQALKLDPEFVLARAYRGQATPGPDGLKELESAASGASALPEAERTLIHGILAGRQGESAKAREAYTKLTTLAPDDWRGHYLLGTQHLGDENYAAAVPELRKAVELEAAAGGANNMLGYAALRQGDTEGAIEAFTDYARTLPQEPNAQDSLGEALLAAGRFAEAESAFRRAVELSPAFFPGWEGIAYAKYYGGDPAAAVDALKKEKEAAVEPNDKLGADRLRAAMAVAQKRTAEGLALYADLEKMPNALPGAAYAPVERAGLLVELGRAREAMPIIAAALKRAESGELPAGFSRNLRVQSLRARVAAEAAMNNAKAAEATAMELQQQASERQDDVNAQSTMHFGLGMAAMAKRDYAGARSHFEQCLTSDELCRLQVVTAAVRAGDKAGAEAARAAMLKLYIRSPMHVWIRARLQEKSS